MSLFLIGSVVDDKFSKHNFLIFSAYISNHITKRILNSMCYRLTASITMQKFLSIRTYLSFCLTTFQKHLHQIIYSKLYFIKILIFFFNYFFFFIHYNHYSFSSFNLVIRKEKALKKKKTKMQMNSDNFE